ncbi:MAG: M20 family metallopeptidase [Haloarculaceae archaeon]
MDVADLARDLVSIPSHEDETAAGDRIEAWLREHTDAAVTRDDAPNGGNVFARKPGPGAASLALVGHHDVVPPDDAQVGPDGYVVEERDGRLSGRGAADMKGAVAAAMCAFRDSDPAGELVFASFVGEEVGGVGARHAVDAGFAPDYAVVGEGSTGYSAPGVTDVAVAHRGRRGSTVLARGDAAHASEPGAGENAVYRACESVDVLRDLDAPTAEVLGHAVEGSVVVTGIEGGTAWNVVPERCTVTVDERTVPGERAAVERVEDVAGVSWTVDQDLPPMACGDEAFAETVLAAATAVQASAPEFVVKPHATDAGWLAGAGTECVVCGPSEPGEAHTADESVSLAVLERCATTYRAVAETLAG